MGRSASIAPDAASLAAGNFEVQPFMPSGSVLALCLAAATATAWAEEPEPAGQEPAEAEVGADAETGAKDLTALSLEQLMEIEVETVYAASRHEQKVTEAPASVTIITSDEMKKFGHRTLADVLRSMRGLQVTYDRNYYYLGVRGFAQPGDYNTRVLVLVDGHRLNDNIYDTGPVGTEFILDVDLIDRVEFIRGPSSSLYGSNAFFGVINVITRKGRQVGRPEISGEAASFATYKGRLSYGQLFENGLEVLLSGTMYDSEGQTLHFKEFDDPATNNGFARGADGEQYHSLFGQATYKDLALQAAFVNREKHVPTGSFGTVFNDPDTKTIDARGYVDLKFEHEFEDVVSVLARVFYDLYYYRGDYISDRTAGGGPPRVVNRDTANGEWWGADFKLSRKVIEPLRLTLGAEYRDNFRVDQTNRDVNPSASFLDDEREHQVVGAYAQGELEILPNLLLNAGVRYDHHDTFGESVNPRAGLIFSPFERTTLKLLYGRAFRAPNAYELYYQDGGFSGKANPDLDPETIDTYEFVYEQYVGQHLRFLASLFHYEIDDLIVQTTDPADGLLVFRNVDEVESNGMEVEAEARFSPGWLARASYAYQRTEDDRSGNRLTNSPPHMAKLNLSAPLLKDKLFAGLEVQYMARRKTLAGKHANDFVVLNFTIFSQKLVEGLEFSASIYNLLDKKYGDPGAGEHVQDEIEQDGISLRFKLTYRF